MKKFLAYFLGGVACMGVGAGIYIAVGLYYHPSAAPKIFGIRATTSEAINGLLPLVDKRLEKDDSKSQTDASGSLGSDNSAASPRDDKGATVFFAGDIMLGRSVAERIKTNGAEYLFAKIKDTVAAADISIANLEGPLTKINNSPANRMVFHFDPALGKELSSTGFDAVSLANNHGLDQGGKGLSDGKKNLDAVGIKYFGDPAATDGPVYQLTANGMKIAVLGFQMVYGQLDPDGYAKAIVAAKKNADYVIVMPHWGVEYQHTATKSQKDMAHLFIDSGADLIVGSHPHVIEGIETYKGKTIFYSLGNLIFDQYFSVDTQQGLALRLKIDASKNISIDLLPYEIPQSQPAFVDGDKKAKMLSDLASWSAPELKDQIIAGELK